MRESGRRVIRHGMIVDVRFFAVPILFGLQIVVVAVQQLAVVVIVRVPVRAVFPFAERQSAVMV